MASRKLLPSTLRTELQEHASLICAMRTEHILNLTSHLIEHLHGDHHTVHDRSNQWTRWPLPDAPPPDWDFADEVGVMIRQEFSKTRELELEDEDYVEDLVQELTPILIVFVERILALLEAHIFSRPPSLQNRINPLNWRDLANILASPMAQDLVDAQTLERYVNRMEAMLGSPSILGPYEPCPRRAVERRRISDKQVARRKKLDDWLVASLLS